MQFLKKFYSLFKPKFWKLEKLEGNPIVIKGTLILLLQKKNVVNILAKLNS